MDITGCIRFSVRLQIYTQESMLILYGSTKSQEMHKQCLQVTTRNIHAASTFVTTVLEMKKQFFDPFYSL